MMKTFGYGRVSTNTQKAENQRQALENLGYKLDYWFEDTASGKTPANKREQFQAMLGKLREGEQLVVLRIDRLGRDAIDILQTVSQLKALGIKVIVHQLGGIDLTSPTGNFMLTMLAGLAEMERELLIERIHDGLDRAKSENKKMGRPAKTTDSEREAIRSQLIEGVSVSQLARNYKISRASVIAIRNHV